MKSPPEKFISVSTIKVSLTGILCLGMINISWNYDDTGL